MKSDSRTISINKPRFDRADSLEVMKVLEKGDLTSAAAEGGERVQKFERELKRYLKVKHVIAVNSGTSALYAALLAAGVGYGDEVILPSFTFVATANAIVAAGAKPVFVDIHKNRFICVLLCRLVYVLIDRHPLL